MCASHVAAADAATAAVSSNISLAFKLAKCKVNDAPPAAPPSPSARRQAMPKIIKINVENVGEIVEKLIKSLNGLACQLTRCPILARTDTIRTNHPGVGGGGISQVRRAL